MKRVIFLHIAVLLLAGACIGNFKTGEFYYQNEQYEKAIAEFDKVLFVSITDIKSMHLRARSYEELEEYDKALDDYKKILNLDPRYAQAYAGMGKIAWKLDDMKTAEKYLLLAAMHDPKDYDILLLLSRTMIKNRRFKSAEEFLEVALELRPEEPMPHYYLGIARGYSGDVLGVVTSFNKYIEYEPDNINAHYNRGFALMRLGYKTWAVEDFDVVLRKNPNHYEALARRALCLIDKNPGKACLDLQTAAKNGNRLARANLGKCGS
ncbi:tetratricopeptide repeat protein [Negadavirga shengliensis]|uniref:Tetratricopeptide repeat protein n=1 Tax=Negadavirga shengliensis TaxID=1389218 RepID=A0ABV9T726_9BACT